MILAGFLILFVFLAIQFKRMEEKTKTDGVLMEWLKTTQTSMDAQLTEHRKTILEQNKILGDRLDNAARVVSEVQKELGKIGEYSKGIKDLQDVLLSPKARGNIGEEVLADLLAQILPHSSFEMQYAFRSGEKVDAAVKTDKGIIPIDSKFPMENFKAMIGSEAEGQRETMRKTFVRDVKKHIDDISKKYILPSEGTIDFALMYVPSETVYYETVIRSPELENFARERRVLLVSPNNLYYFLRVILIGLQQKDLAENAMKIWESLRTLKKETEKFGSELSVLDGHLNRARGSMDSVLNRYTLFMGKIDALSTEEKKAIEEPLE